MKISEQWLREWVSPAVTTAELVETLTMAGLEVDAVEPVAGDFSGVVVGEIVSIEQHPDADKLRVCQVAGGEQVVQVVCGAANARAGLKIPFATVGAVLPSDDAKGFKIKKAKLRGVESFGMLCAEQELGMAESSDGLMELPADAPVGTNIREYLALDDSIIEVDLTPNRADCLSVAGIARDVGVLYKLAVNELKVAAVSPEIPDTLAVSIEATDDCPNYVGRVIRDVDLSVSSPLWMQEKLRRAGIRSIDAVVDVTNYVLLELGQPMHAFDLNTLGGGIVVRHAEKEEALTLLDGQELALKAGSLVIADQTKAVALAGIMGGEVTGVTEKTTDIFLESAFFTPVNIAGRARGYGLHTDSSHRFERGVDYQLQEKAIERATQLLLDIVGGQPGPVIVETAEQALPKTAVIHLREARIERVLGLKIPSAEVEQMLLGLGMQVTPVDDGWQVQGPSWRFDMAIEADLLEEIARIYGYNRLPVTKIHAELGLRAKPESETPQQLIRRQLVAKGYQEAITYSFIDPKTHDLVSGGAEAVKLTNPISADMSVMRTSLWPGLLSALQHNVNRQQHRVRLFELGLSFIPSEQGLPVQKPMLAAVLTGRRNPESWLEQGEAVDFYDIKGDVESLLAACGILSECEFSAAECQGLHPGQTAAIRRQGDTLGYVGAIHPELQKQLGLSQTVYLFQLDLQLISSRSLPAFAELSKFPEVRRDLAVIVDREIPAANIMSAVKGAAGEHFANFRLFDIYEGKGIDTKRKSLAIGLTFQHSSRTLNEDEINVCVENVVNVLQTQFEATLRN